MFSGFNIKIDESFFGANYKFLILRAICFGSKHNSVKDNIKDLIKSDSLSASQISEDWFPQVEADVFISHSSSDKELALALAGWLVINFGINSFIDSLFWNYAGDLLTEINNEYSERRNTRENGVLYNHQKCNKASEHVNILLNAALHKLIDKTESVFFLNTDNSIQVFDHEGRIIQNTYSPWIFSEILCTQIVRKKPLIYYRPKYNIQSTILEHSDIKDFQLETRSLEIPYEVSLRHLENVSERELEKWLHMDKSKFFGYPLDGLYYLSTNYRDELRRARKYIAHKNNIRDSDFLL